MSDNMDNVSDMLRKMQRAKTEALQHGVVDVLKDPGICAMTMVHNLLPDVYHEMEKDINSAEDDIINDGFIYDLFIKYGLATKPRLYLGKKKVYTACWANAITGVIIKAIERYNSHA